MRLLIVEDFEPLRRTLVRGFADQGFAVDATGDGSEGLWYATSNDYDVIILDLMLPGKSGLEILSALRATEKDIPVLLLTAKDEVDDRVRGLNLGADDYLTKPFAVPELLARVRSLTRRGHHRRPTSRQPESGDAARPLATAGRGRAALRSGCGRARTHRRGQDVDL